MLPEEQLALDEAMLHLPDGHAGLLRFWESDRPFVVLGHNGKLREEVHVEACEREAIPILRRVTGGGTVLQGPGCLNYALALSLERYPELRDVRHSACIILGKVGQAFSLPVEVCGLLDLALDGRKVSGSAQRRTRGVLLHHGTLLYNFEVKLVERYLQEPKRQPEYRRGRPHAEFLGNLPLTAEEIKDRISSAFTSVIDPQNCSR
ncbi:MAG: lipoate--protein ligase family protein [Bryobacteraceae bacterium]